MNARTVRSSLPLAVLAALAATGCSSLPFGQPEEPALVVQSQPKGNGTSVTIASFTLPEDGYVVVHADANGRPGPVIGQTELIEAGTYTNVPVRIDASRAGERVHPMLHVDDGDGVYEFPGADGPATSNGAVIVEAVNWL